MRPSVYKTRGRWTVSIGVGKSTTIGGKTTGRKRKTFSARTEKEAWTKYEMWRMGEETGKTPLPGAIGGNRPKGRKGQTFDYYCEQWVLSDNSLEDVSIADRRWKVGHARLKFGDRHISEIDHNDLQALFKEELDGKETQSKIRGALVNVFDAAFLDGVIELNPANHIRISHKVKATAKEKRLGVNKARWALSLDQQHALIDKCAELYPHHVSVVVIMLEMGVRPQELRTLDWSDVYLDAEVPYVRLHRRAKNFTSKRKLKLHTKSLEVFTELRSESEGEGLVWFRKMARGNLLHRIKTSAEKAGIERPVAVYDLRHTAATRMAKSMSLLDLQKQLGHTGPEMVGRIYYHDDGIISGEELPSRVDPNKTVGMTIAQIAGSRKELAEVLEESLRKILVEKSMEDDGLMETLQTLGTKG